MSYPWLAIATVLFVPPTTAAENSCVANRCFDEADPAKDLETTLLQQQLMLRSADNIIMSNYKKDQEPETIHNHSWGAPGGFVLEHSNTAVAPGKIDVEEHVLLPGQSDENVNPMVIDQFWDSGQGRLNDMDVGDIAASVISATEPCLQELGTETNLVGMSTSQVKKRQIEMATDWNNKLFQITRNSSSRYSGFASLPTLSPAEAAKELTRCVRELSMVGAKINGVDYSIDGMANYYDSEDYGVLWQTFEELDVPLFIHPQHSHSSDPLYQKWPDMTGAMWGYTEETAHMILNLVLNGLFQRHPKLKILIGHMGESLVFQASRFDRRNPLLNYSLTDVLRNNFYISTSGFPDTAALQHAIQIVGVERVLYATDYPNEDPAEYRAWFDQAVKDLALNQSERDMIEFKNAEHLFKLKLQGSANGTTDEARN